MPKLDWVVFLNEACTWETKEQANNYLQTIAGTAIDLSASEMAELSAAEAYMREQLNALHFGRALSIQYINERLAHVKLQLRAADNDLNSGLPSLSAFSSGRSDVGNIIETLLFQFAVFLGDTMDGAATYRVGRCEALCRSKTVADCTAFYRKFRSLEESWKEEIAHDLANTDEIERCADFFVATHGGKFCSDACRFNSFALRKQLENPDYQAEKQRRYRSRKSKNHDA
jgi:hypothetical protein